MRNIAISLLLFAFASVTHACGVCVTIRGDPFALPHPRAIEIALANRTALDAGLLRSVPTHDTGSWNRREPASDRTLAQAWSDRAKVFVGTDEPWSFHIVLIDTAQSLIVHFRSGAVVLETGTLDRGHAAVATTLPALQALLVDHLDWAKAIESKLVIVDGGDPRTAERLNRVFSRVRGR